MARPSIVPPLALGLTTVGSEPIVSQNPVPGLVWSYEFDEEGRGRPLSLEDAVALDDERRGFVWLHFNLVDVRVCDWCIFSRENTHVLTFGELLGEQEGAYTLFPNIRTSIKKLSRSLAKSLKKTR